MEENSFCLGLNVSVPKALVRMEANRLVTPLGPIRPSGPESFSMKHPTSNSITFSMDFLTRFATEQCSTIPWGYGARTLGPFNPYTIPCQLVRWPALGHMPVFWIVASVIFSFQYLLLKAIKGVPSLCIRVNAVAPKQLLTQVSVEWPAVRFSQFLVVIISGLQATTGCIARMAYVVSIVWPRSLFLEVIPWAAAAFQELFRSLFLSVASWATSSFHQFCVSPILGVTSWMASSPQRLCRRLKHFACVSAPNFFIGVISSLFSSVTSWIISPFRKLYGGLKHFFRVWVLRPLIRLINNVLLNLPLRSVAWVLTSALLDAMFWYVDTRDSLIVSLLWDIGSIVTGGWGSILEGFGIEVDSEYLGFRMTMLRYQIQFLRSRFASYPSKARVWIQLAVCRWLSQCMQILFGHPVQFMSIIFQSISHHTAIITTFEVEVEKSLKTIVFFLELPLPLFLGGWIIYLTCSPLGFRSDPWLNQRLPQAMHQIRNLWARMPLRPPIWHVERHFFQILTWQCLRDSHCLSLLSIDNIQSWNFVVAVIRMYVGYVMIWIPLVRFDRLNRWMNITSLTSDEKSWKRVDFLLAWAVKMLEHWMWSELFRGLYHLCDVLVDGRFALVILFFLGLFAARSNEWTIERRFELKLFGTLVLDTFFWLETIVRNFLSR